MDASMSVRFREGLAWLDSEYPAWRSHVSADTLDMRESHLCVLAQLTGTGRTSLITPYLNACKVLGLTTEQAYALGFDTSPGTGYPELTAMWRDAIRFPVKVLAPADPATDRATCGTCGRSWDDAVSTAWTPVPSGRCPFEYWHVDGDENTVTAW